MLLRVRVALSSAGLSGRHEYGIHYLAYDCTVMVTSQGELPQSYQEAHGEQSSGECGPINRIFSSTIQLEYFYP